MAAQMQERGQADDRRGHSKPVVRPEGGGAQSGQKGVKQMQTRSQNKAKCKRQATRGQKEHLSKARETTEKPDDTQTDARTWARKGQREARSGQREAREKPELGVYTEA